MTEPLRLQRELSVEAPQTKLAEDKEFVVTLKPLDATPSVLNAHVFKLANTAPFNLTYFDDGFDGKTIRILGDGFTTAVHDSTKLLTNIGADILLSSVRVYVFTRYDRKWIEDA